MAEKRKNIPDHVRIRIWTEAGGRCQFKGCNKPLWYNRLTLSKGNFSEMAHIIGASEDGPRGDETSEIQQDNPENIMLLCKDCHKEIDDCNNIDKYPADLLRKWKKEHEERINIQTSIHDEIYKTTILRFQYNIGTRIVNIADEQVYNAINPKYPSDRKGILIKKENFVRENDFDYWMVIANEIETDLKRKFELGIDGSEIRNISVFALGAMPLLMYLGKCLTDTIPVDIYHHNRNIENINKAWCWDDSDNSVVIYNTEVLNEINDSKDVVIILALSDFIEPDKYKNLFDGNCNIYKLSIDEPSPLFLKNKNHLEAFSYEFRKLLNLITKKHGFESTIHILPAIPASLAVQLGRLLLPTKDPEIFVYEFYPDSGFKKVLKLN